MNLSIYLVSTGSADWKAEIREQMQRELEEKVRAVLKTPPIERLQKLREQNKTPKETTPDILQFNDQLLQNWNKSEKEYYRRTHRTQLAIKKQRLVTSFVHSAPPLYEPFVRNDLSELGCQGLYSANHCVFIRPDPQRVYEERDFIHLEKQTFCKVQRELGFYWPDSLGPLLPSIKFQNEATSFAEPLAQYISGKYSFRLDFVNIFGSLTIGASFKL